MNNSLGVKYKTGVKFAVIGDNGEKNKCYFQVIMIDTKSNKIVDKFMPVKYDWMYSGFSMWVRPLGSREMYKRISEKDFLKKYCVNQEESFNINNIKLPKDVVVWHRSAIIDFFKRLSKTNSKGIMHMTEKHIGIEMIYGYNINKDNLKRIMINY